jgi:hypothetical protein
MIDGDFYMMDGSTSLLSRVLSGHQLLGIWPLGIRTYHPPPSAEVWFGVFQTPNLQGRHVNLEGW